MITPPVTIMTHGIVAVAAAAGAWVWQANSYEAKLAAVQTEYAQAQARAVENANAETTRLQNQKDAALRTAAQRQRFWQSQNSALERDVDGLRGDLARYRTERESLPGDPVSPGADYTSALETVFGDCATEVVRMEGLAQGHANDVQTLREAWPTPATRSEPRPPAEPEPSQ